MLGLSRYLCVLDSRVKAWCSQTLEGRWRSIGLGTIAGYMKMADVLRELCRRADVVPCIFDAAVFSAMGDVPSRACRFP